MPASCSTGPLDWLNSTYGLSPSLAPAGATCCASWGSEAGVVQENNHHEMFAALVDALGDASLGKLLLGTTYHYIRALLASPHLKTKSGERSLLSNLGSWLGRLTLARQQPIRQRDLDLKQTMYEAYEQGKMIAVMPFLVKVRLGLCRCCCSCDRGRSLPSKGCEASHHVCSSEFCCLARYTAYYEDNCKAMLRLAPPAGHGALQGLGPHLHQPQPLGGGHLGPGCRDLHR